MNPARLEETMATFVTWANSAKSAFSPQLHPILKHLA